jgi:hypothetical protein
MNADYALHAPPLVWASGDMDDLLELLFPDDPELSSKHLHTQDPASIMTHLATRGAQQE